MKVSKPAKYTIGLSQQDERCFPKCDDFKYDNCRVILFKENSKTKSFLNGIEFVAGTKSNQERDTYLEVEFLESGFYYVLFETEKVSTVTLREVESYALNAYGEADVKF